MLWFYAFTKMSIEIAMIIYGTYECDAWLLNSDYVCCVGYWVGGCKVMALEESCS